MIHLYNLRIASQSHANNNNFLHFTFFASHVGLSQSHANSMTSFDYFVFDTFHCYISFRMLIINNYFMLTSVIINIINGSNT